MGRENSLVRIDYTAVKEFIDRMLNGESGSKEEALKQRILQSILGYSEETKNWIVKVLSLSRKITDEVAEGYAAAGYSVLKLHFKLATPGLVGAGGSLLKPVFEVGLSVHPLLGLPYYPGSGVKGTVRAFAEMLLGENVASILFGHVGEEGAGVIVFSDMLPVGCSTKKCSIYRGLVVTPHYHRGGKAVPNELYAVPSPVPHLGIEEGTVFLLVAAIHPYRAKGAYKRLRERLKKEFDDGSLCGAEIPEARLYENLCNTLKKAVENIGEPARALAAVTYVLLNAALGSGIASRATKGYNIFEEYLGDLQFDIVGYSYEFALSDHGQKQRQGSRKDKSRQHVHMRREHRPSRGHEFTRSLR